jgi:RND family efflux transporter MFP subunit
MFAVLLLALAGVCVAIVARMDGADPGHAATERPGLSAGQETAHPVEVAQPVKAPLRRDLRIPGTLAAWEVADLYAKTSGYVISVEVDIGSRVSAGDVLLRLDVPEMAEDLRQAEAELDARRAAVQAASAQAERARLAAESAAASEHRAEAEAALARITATRKAQLHEARAISSQELDEASSQLAVAEAALRMAAAGVAAAEGDIAAAGAAVRVAQSGVAVTEAVIARLQALLRYATVTAPFEGVITRRLVDRGAFVRSAADGATTALLTLAGTDRVRLVLEIPETEAPLVGVGTPVLVEIPALGAEPLEASISRTALALEPATRTMRVEADLKNPDDRLRPGMYARTIVRAQTKEALTIPSRAIRVRGGQTTVLVADTGIAREVPVRIGYDDGILTEIIEGLEGGEKVITSATGAVAPGAAVQPVPVAVETER